MSIVMSFISAGVLFDGALSILNEIKEIFE